MIYVKEPAWKFAHSSCFINLICDPFLAGNIHDIRYSFKIVAKDHLEGKYF